MEAYDNLDVNEEARQWVVIGGGSGASTLVRGIHQEHPEDAVWALVTSYDDGGASKIEVDELGVSPPGDRRKSFEALLDDNRLETQFRHRFGSEDTPLTVRRATEVFMGLLVDGGRCDNEDLAQTLPGHIEEISRIMSPDEHPLGNLIIAASERLTGDPNQGSLAVGELLGIKRGGVLPTSLGQYTLALARGGNIIVAGQSDMDHHEMSDPFAARIAFLEGANAGTDGRQVSADANPLALAVLDRADVVVTGVGSGPTSVWPALAALGSEGLSVSDRTGADKLVAVSNLFAQPSEVANPRWDLVSQLLALKGYAGAFGNIVYNTDTEALESRGLKPLVLEAEIADRLLPADAVQRIGRPLVGAEAIQNPNDRLQYKRAKILHNAKAVAGAIEDEVLGTD